MEREGLKQISDTGALEKIVDEVIAANPKQVEQYKGGKTTVMGFLVGQVMKASRGQANPAAVNEMLRKKTGIDMLKEGDQAPELQLQTRLRREPFNSPSLQGQEGRSSISIPRPTRPAAQWRPASFGTPSRSSRRRTLWSSGISPDTPKAQANFKAKTGLPSLLLCDVDKSVAEAYGVLEREEHVRQESDGCGAHHVRDRRRRPDRRRSSPKVKAEGHAERSAVSPSARRWSRRRRLPAAAPGRTSPRADARLSSSQMAFRRMPMPWPWTMRTRLAVAITARSRNLSTASRASSARWPMTLISCEAGSSSGAGWKETFFGSFARAAGVGQHFQHVVDRDLHLHEAGFDFDAVRAQLAPHARRLAHVPSGGRARLLRSSAGAVRPGASPPASTSTVVWNSSRNSRFAFDTRGAAPARRPCAARRSARSGRSPPAPALRISPAPARCGAPAPSAWPISRFSHSRASSFSRSASSDLARA